jgi:hypothetical protein
VQICDVGCCVVEEGEEDPLMLDVANINFKLRMLSFDVAGM